MANSILINNEPHVFKNGGLQIACTPSGNPVQIQPLTVEIFTMRVGSRQVTQSIFRQLPQKAFLDNYGKINGNIWGKVRYNFGNFSNPDGYHIVFDKEGKLFRDWVEENRILASSSSYDENAFFYLLQFFSLGFLQIRKYDDRTICLEKVRYDGDSEIISEIFRGKGVKTEQGYYLYYGNKTISIVLDDDGDFSSFDPETQKKIKSLSYLEFAVNRGLKLESSSIKCLGLRSCRDALSLFEILDGLEQLFIAV